MAAVKDLSAFFITHPLVSLEWGYRI